MSDEPGGWFCRFSNQLQGDESLCWDNEREGVNNHDPAEYGCGDYLLVPRDKMEKLFGLLSLIVEDTDDLA